jgi:hypothetical protein
MNDPRQSRGYRNCNPGNIDYNPNNKWLGLAEPPIESPPLNGGKARFCRFVSHQYGIRALALLLQTYQDRHGLRDVRGIINRWAPSNENNTSAYQIAVANRLGVGVTDHIDLHDPEIMRNLVTAIIHHELGGNPYDERTIREGLKLAGLVEPGVKESRTAKAAAGTAVAGAGAAASMEVVASMVPHADRVGDLLRSLGPWVVALVVILAAGYFIWQRRKQQEELLG